MKTGLTTILSRFGVRQLPNPDCFSQLVLGVASYHFIRKPASVISEIHAGIPQQHLSYWNSVNVGELFSIYNALQVSSPKVLAMIGDGIETTDHNQERVLTYLQQFIGI